MWLCSPVYCVHSCIVTAGNLSQSTTKRTVVQTVQVVHFLHCSSELHVLTAQMTEPSQTMNDNIKILSDTIRETEHWVSPGATGRLL